MNVPLRVSVVLLVAAINVLVFGAGLVWLTFAFAERQEEEERELSDLLAERIQYLVDDKGELKASGILRWPSWSSLEDAIIVQLGEDEVLGEASKAGRPPSGARTTPPWTGAPDRPRGVSLNPVGSSHRSLTFDHAGVFEDIRRAVREDRMVRTERGMSVPVRDTSGALWGGSWFVPRRSWTPGGLFRGLLPWFVVSTLFLTLGTFAALRRLVLDPVQELARVSRTIAAGDLSVRMRTRRRGDEVSELIQSFNEMADQVQGFNARLAHEVEVATGKAREAEAAAMTQRRLAATGELAAGIAHEINNPLGGMLNAVEVLERDDLKPDKRARYNELLKSGLERIRDTVGRLLRLAPRRVHPEPLSLARPIGDAVGLVRHRAAQLGVTILLHARGETRDVEDPAALALLDDLPPVMGESNELGQAMLNLLVNALDSLEEHGGSAVSEGRGRVEIGVEEAGGELHVSVQDDGPGVPRELFDRVADAFFTTKPQGRGTGLGLAIVHNVITGHGGRVRIARREGGGCRVDLVLPRWRGDAGAAGGSA